MTFAESARCALHPDVAAVDVCSRCGAFACGECADVGPDDVTVCVTCLPRLVPEQVPRGASLALAFGFTGAVVTFFLFPGLMVLGLAHRPTLFAVTLTLTLGLPFGAVALGALNWKSGGWRARVGVILGAIPLSWWALILVWRPST